MTTGIQCTAHPDCPVPAPAETGLCHIHAQQATKAGPAIRTVSLARQVRRAWSREPEKELEP